MKYTILFVVIAVLFLISGCATTGSYNTTGDSVDSTQTQTESPQTTDKTLSALIDIIGAWYLDCH